MAPLLQFVVFCAILCESVFGIVPQPTNISIVCHNFENILYWNYSNPSDQLKFNVNINSYESDLRTVETSETHLNISSYTSDGGDDYVVSVKARIGQEESESIFIKFTYSKDYFDEKIHKYKCTLDFPAIETSVHKDVIQVSFKHPYSLYDQKIPKEEFEYTVIHDQIKTSYYCEDDDELDHLCVEDIHMNQSYFGQQIELKFEGKIAAIPSHANMSVFFPPPNNDNGPVIPAFIGGAIVLLFIIAGVMWLLCKKEIPNVPKSLRNFMNGPCHTPLESEPPAVSPLSPVGHTPLLMPQTDVCLDISAPPILVDEDGSKTTSTHINTEVDEPGPSEEEENYDDSSDFCRSSDYDSPKCLLEMGPGDFTEGYGPRPRILPLESESE